MGHGHGGASPIGIEYACDNLFVITNANPRLVTVTYKVAGNTEGGSLNLAAAPEEDPHFSETLLRTRGQGTVELYNDRSRIGVIENGRIRCDASPAAARTAAAGRAAASVDTGAWSAPFYWPVVAVHLSLMPNGRVLSWGKIGAPRIWNPATGAFTSAPSPDWLFCSAHTFLGDGRLLVAGGHIDGALGLPDINLFSAAAGWIGTSPMRRGRWYPTATTLASGQVVITAGTDQQGDNVPLPEVWTPGGLRVLTGASQALPWYPRAFLAPNGKLFYAGEAQMTRYLDVTGAGAWTTVGNRRHATRGYGSAAMYEPGKVVYSGGGRTTNTAEVIDLNRAAPAWSFTAPMAFARRHHTLTVLPTGQVLATGGVAGILHNDITKAVRAAEIWTPSTGTWRTLASGAVPRGYHATSILMPDGRVLHTGSGDAEDAPRELNAELFSPPYLFAGARPTISSAPSVAVYRTTFRVIAANASSIAKISLIRLGSVTHAFDMNQRYQTLSFTADASGLTVTAPTSRRLTPPGHYMLFVLNASGVPSVAKIVQIR